MKEMYLNKKCNSQQCKKERLQYLDNTWFNFQYP